MAIGVDLENGRPEKQELWWFDAGERSPIIRRRTEESSVLAAGAFRVLPFICGSIFGNDGVELNFAGLVGVDVVIDAGHASLNPQWAKTIAPHVGPSNERFSGSERIVVRSSAMRTGLASLPSRETATIGSSTEGACLFRALAMVDESSRLFSS
jgi:hypothetical protein